MTRMAYEPSVWVMHGGHVLASMKVSQYSTSLTLPLRLLCLGLLRVSILVHPAARALLQSKVDCRLGRVRVIKFLDGLLDQRSVL